MPFDFEMLKKHPYATGGIVIVGGVVVFYLLSSKSSGASPSGTGSNFQAELAASTAAQNVAAQENIQAGQTNAQIQQAQIAANSQNYATQAAVQSNQDTLAAQLAQNLAAVNGQVQVAGINANATTAQQYNAAISTQNEVSMQDAVLQSQINQGTIINANNNATALAGLESNNALTYGLGSQTISAGYNLAQTQQANFQQNVQTIVPLAGQQKNSALDANNQTALFQTILANGNPGVAASGNAATTSAVISGNNSGVANTAAIVGGVSGVVNNVAKGLMG